MAGCVLRVDGVFTRADAPTEFELLGVEIRRHGDGVLEVTEAEDLATQCSEAESFLLSASAHLRSLNTRLAVKDLTLDFGLWQKPVAAQFIDFPASLVAAAGACGVGISASLYACDDDEA